MQARFSIPVDKANAHGVGSAITYAKRFTLSAVLGIVADDDDDGNAASKGPGSHASRSIDQARKDIEEQTGNSKSTYDLAKQKKAVETLKLSAKLAMDLCKNKTMLMDWWSENGEALLAGLPDDEFEAIKAAVKKKRAELPELEKVA